MMNNSFISDEMKMAYSLMQNLVADEVYEFIYRQAKSSIYVVDNYIGLEERHLRIFQQSKYYFI